MQPNNQPVIKNIVDTIFSYALIVKFNTLESDRKINWIQAPGFIRGKKQTILSLFQVPGFRHGVNLKSVLESLYPTGSAKRYNGGNPRTATFRKIQNPKLNDIIFFFNRNSHIFPIVNYQPISHTLFFKHSPFTRAFTDKKIVSITTKLLELSDIKNAYLLIKSAIALQKWDINQLLSKLNKYRVAHLPRIDEQEELVKIITPKIIDNFYHNLSHAVMLKLQQVVKAMKIPVIYPSVSAGKPKDINQCVGKNQDELEKHDKPSLLLDIATTHQEAETSVQFPTNILSQVNDAVIVTDNQHKVTYWSCKAEELYNLKVSEIIGQPIEVAFECVWLYPEQQQACAHALTNNGSWKGENIHHQPNGEEIHVESSISVLKDERGTIIGFLLVVRDMRDVYEEVYLRKLAEQTLREREERWNLVLEGSNDGIWDWNVQTNEVFFSSRWKQMRGFAEDEIGNSLDEWSQRVHSDELDWVMQSVTDYFARKTPLFAVEYRTLCKDGTYKWIFSRGIALWDEQGYVLRMAGSETDITARKLAEQQVREQAALIDITTDAILVLSLTGKIVFCNQGGQRVYGWEQDQIQGKNAHQLLYDDSSLPQLELAMKTVLEQGEWHGELHQYRQDERKIIVEARWTVIRDEQGNPKSILTVATDITEKKQLEAQFLRTQRLQSIGTLASGIAHDLNNILTPILAVAQLLPLKLPHVDENTQDLIKIVLDNCKRGSDLIKQILSFARGTETQRTTLQVGHLLVEVARVARQTFPKSIEICMDIATKDLWTVSADATQLHQVLMNLCLNARDAMEYGGTLTLAIANFFIDENYARMHLDATMGAYVVITIADTGCGITTENLDRIFEPFFTTKELGKGTGLGLSTVVGIIKSHGGFVDVYSEVGSGTRFKIYLPAVEGTELQTFSELEPPGGSGELILVVDDEISILEITKTSLETYNYQALIAKDGIEAIALFAKHEREIKAVLIDLMMPNLDTMTTIRTLQKLNPQVPIIVMSGLASNEVLSKAASTDIQAFLAKPFTAWELLNTLQKVRIQSQ